MNAETLEALRRVLDPARMVLIGATALSHHLNMRWRVTADLDLAVAVEMEECAAAMNRHSEWKQDADFELRWRRSGVAVDLIPAGPRLLAVGALELRNGRRISLLGMRHALDRARPMGQTLEAPLVAPVSVIALLKIVAFGDRPLDRERDLHDLAYILEDYPDPDDPRRFGEEVVASNIPYEESGAFLLGLELSAFTTAEERATIERFLTDVVTERDGGRSQALMLRNGPAIWRREPEPLIRKIEALKRGLDWKP